MKSLKEEYKHNAERYAGAISILFAKNPVKKKMLSQSRRIERTSFKKCHEIFDMMKTTHQLFQIEEFMSHESPSVRYLSAAHCLYSNPIIAEKTLENLIESNLGDVSMKALATLKAWRNIPWTEDIYK